MIDPGFFPHVHGLARLDQDRGVTLPVNGRHRRIDPARQSDDDPVEALAEVVGTLTRTGWTTFMIGDGMTAVFG